MKGIAKAGKVGLLLLLLCGLSAQPAMASFEKAMEIYTAKKYEEAKEAFEVMASIGDRASIFNLGVMYFRGEAVEPDAVKAYALMVVANEGLKDENFTNITQSVYKRLSAEQLAGIDAVYQETKAVYGREIIETNIFPQLLDDEDCAPDAVPIKRAPLRYPKSESRRGRMGLVYSEFTISPQGYVRDISITSSTSRAFTKVAVDAMSKYRYEPPINGLPIMWHRLSIAFRFEKKAGAKYTTSTIVKSLKDLKSRSENGEITAQYMYGLSINRYRRFKEFFKNTELQWRDANHWYTKSAKGGVVNAQFEIGRNMLEGRGCEVDAENGLKWIKASAIGGYSPAQAYLATTNFSQKRSDKDKSLATIAWLRNAVQADNYAAGVMLAWELLASPEESVHNVDEALSLIEEDTYDYHDDVRLLETQALAFSHKGKFAKAVKLQKKAAKIAQSREWVIPKIQQRLQLYENQQMYVGAYY